MSKIRYTFTENKVIAIVKDGLHLWTAFKGADGVSKVIKSTIYDPTRVLYEISINVDEVVDMVTNATYVFLAVKDDDYIGVRIPRQNPLGSTLYYDKPGTISEDCVGVTVGTGLYFLIPGELSGENARILRYNTVNTILQENIELDIGAVTIRNASAIDIDGDNEILYIATNEDPITLAKLYDDSGWQLLSWQIE